MKGRIFKSIFAAAMVVFLCTFCFSLGAVYRYFSDEQLSELGTELKYLKKGAESDGASYLTGLGDTDSRITLIDADGTVLFDTSALAEDLPNHGDREEFIAAKRSGIGTSVRYSETLSKRTINYAEKLSDGSILRVSRTQSSLVSLIIGMFYGIVLVIALAVALSVFLAARISDFVTRPINRIDISNPDEREVYEELKPLVQKISAQNHQLYDRMEQLREEHAKQDALRREFTANVSHELKTPLTSISGYAELIREGLAKPEDIPAFAGRIHSESSRMLSLVDDIIRLSRLDGTDPGDTESEVDLLAEAEAAADSLSEEARKRGIKITVSGNSLKIMGYRRMIFEIVRNLCDNAVKYNVDGGKVDILVFRSENGASIAVQDSGIGIPKKEQERIFERFYRVDKSRSKAAGGTGLGLSIVKHAALHHGASVSVESEPGRGSRITVAFPASRLIDPTDQIQSMDETK